MPAAPSSDPKPIRPEPVIYTIRGQRVILDSDLARIYGVSTSRFNEAFKRNLERFPPDFAFQVTQDEGGFLISQFATSKMSFVTEHKDGRGGRRKLPWVFTEHGAVMAANILRGEHAIRMSVFVVRAFVHLREQITANEAILARLSEIDDQLLEHDDSLRDLYEKILLLLDPPPDPENKRRLGLHPEE